MKKWLKNYLIYVVVAFSLLFNLTLYSQTQMQNRRLIALQNQIDNSAITIAIYDGNNALVKDLTFLPSDNSISLYDLLITLNERQLLTSSVATSGWIMSLHDIDGTGIDNKYWIIFSSTNIACSGYSDPGYEYENVCNFGSKDILIGYKDSFEFRLLAWNA